MAIAIDGSTPSFHSTGIDTPANTCAAFTPPSDALLLAMWAGDSQSADTPTTPTVTNAPSSTWVTDGWDSRTSGLPTLDGQAAAFHSLLHGSPGSTTVTVTNAGIGPGNDSMLQVYVLTGHDPTTPVGVTGAGRQSGGSSLSDSYTGSITGGQGFMILCDWSAQNTATWVADTGCTLEDQGTNSGLVSFAAIRRTSPDGVQGGTTSLGVSGLLSGGKYHWVYLEIISYTAAQAAAQAGYPVIGASPPMF